MAQKRIGSTVIRGKQVDLFEPTDREVEVFVDAVQGMSLQGPIVKFNLCRTEPQHFGPDNTEPETVTRVVVSRVVMGVDTFLNVVDFLNKQAEQVRQHVVIKPEGQEH